MKYLWDIVATIVLLGVVAIALAYMCAELHP
jgi:hypothetical protein